MLFRIARVGTPSSPVRERGERERGIKREIERKREGEREGENMVFEFISLLLTKAALQIKFFQL
jgi:hypothetical protein